MSLDRSLKLGGKLASKRSVLKREERIAKMTEDKKFDAGKSKPLGLPKTLVPKT
jgi:small basic protein (TIGR04137 family)